MTFRNVENPNDPNVRLAHQILCARYTMVSAGMSIIPEFLEKMERDGTSDFFKTTKTDIINKATGSRIMFRGIKTSSGNQTAKLKSIHGLTVFVCDEAEEWTSYDDFEKIMLSIRTVGIQNVIIIIMNPTDSNHFIYQKYIKDTHRIEYFDGVPVQISTHPNVLHIHTTFLDNILNLSPQFLAEVKQMKKSNPERYAHIVMGQWSDVAEGAVFKKWGIVKEFPTQCKHVALGIDFGYTHDPTAIVMCGIWDNRLYLKLLCYRTGMLSKDIIKFLQPYSGLMVFADSADPRLIDEIALGGIMIYPVQKPNGSIVAGIDKMQSYDDIFVTEDSIDLQDEMRNYVWDKDKDGNYINQPIDAWNHAIDAARYYALGKLLGKIVKNLKVTKKNSKVVIK
jgi:phage terminase large subunit